MIQNIVIIQSGAVLTDMGMRRNIPAHLQKSGWETTVNYCTSVTNYECVSAHQTQGETDDCLHLAPVFRQVLYLPACRQKLVRLTYSILRAFTKDVIIIKYQIVV